MYDVKFSKRVFYLFGIIYIILTVLWIYAMEAKETNRIDGALAQNSVETTVKFRGKVVGTIKVFNYAREVEVLPDSTTLFGVMMKAKFDGTASSDLLNRCKRTRWIQVTLSSPVPAERREDGTVRGAALDLPFIYPPKGGFNRGENPIFDDKPFVWDDDQVPGDGHIEYFPRSTENGSYKFETYLICEDYMPRQFSILGSFQWGYVLAQENPPISILPVQFVPSDLDMRKAMKNSGFIDWKVVNTQ